MLRLAPWMLALFFVAACSSTKPDLKKKQAALHFSAGTKSLMDQNYTEALKSLLKANELEPKNSEILTNLGMAYYFKGEKDLAVRNLKEALELNSKNSDARVNLASIQFNDRNYPEAERLYKEVLRDLTYDKQARTYYNLGLIELKVRRNPSAAEDYFSKAIKEDENYCPAYFQLGMVSFGQRRFNTALKNFKEAGAGTCYESPAPHYYQGLTLMELGRFDEARMKLDEVESRFKKSPFAAKARARALELTSIEVNRNGQEHASKQTVLESPEF